MPMFYYNLRSGDYLAEGTVGVHSPDMESARKSAIIAARHVLTQSAAMRLPANRGIVEVCDDQGSTLFSISLKDVLHS